jgi:LysR family glycine cleavage system transcriptional activator
MPREDVDVAVRHGDGHWLGLHVTRLCSELPFAVCSPTLGAKLKRPKDLLKLPLLHLDDRGPWTAWLEAAGVADANAPHGPVLNRASLSAFSCGRRRGMGSGSRAEGH